ncbi:tRNA-dihydrouridine(20/20a) synthase [Aureimonas endophytica]|uniref:tRNA-dihydrouridine(20/20a) synthase n=1 Tax=Aureimonas endophytica TaxID=2027858 RepID=A0A917DZV4_9HYPH|nr:tRNA dihydrouridine(20/20a) synthase DusA [Aureimonas endophytica]GGD86687.1 tRNA-dihydrouridine(20/20a) synthase [Aureimonas endophytica]
MTETPPTGGRPRFAVAPMIDWTDRHCRFFHRQLSREALLFTEMVVADAVIHGDRERLLGFDGAEHPLALQLGGADPEKLARATRIAAEFGYDEINLNVGCPSDRVQSGTFGACMMRVPDLVGECLQAMREASPVPVSVKCRIGVDEQDPEEALDRLADAAVAAGIGTIWVHARKAWLQGLSPKENREIPPLDYDRVHRLKRRLPRVFVGLNGGLATVAAALPHLARLDGVMMGRGAYQTPAELALVDAALAGGAPEPVDWRQVVQTMADYAEGHIARGGRLHHVARHMVGLFTGRPGARRWRQILSEAGSRHDARPDLLLDAFSEVDLGAPARAA